MLVIDDGLQNTAGLLCPRRSVLVATVVGVIQGNMGELGFSSPGLLLTMLCLASLFLFCRKF